MNKAEIKELSTADLTERLEQMEKEYRQIYIEQGKAFLK